MAKLEQNVILDLVKKALMIPASEKFADDELMVHIEGCKELLVSAGTPKQIADSDNPLVKGLIIIYVKTYYGFKNDGSVKELPSNFDMLLKQLVLSTSGVTDVS